jgi:hypothetical protein
MTCVGTTGCLEQLDPSSLWYSYELILSVKPPKIRFLGQRKVYASSRNRCERYLLCNGHLGLTSAVESGELPANKVITILVHNCSFWKHKFPNFL